MNTEMKAKWLEALRSGEYAQATGVLRNDSNEFCCLGVLCNLAEIEGIGHWEKHQEDYDSYLWRFVVDEKQADHNGEGTTVLPTKVVEKFDLPDHTATVYELKKNGGHYQLSALNDNGRTFREIADIIEKYL